MSIEVREAESDDDREAAYRLRYDVYVEEMGRYGAIADHDNRRLVEPVDATSRIFVAFDGERAVGTSRITWGGDAAFCERHVEQYRLAPFLDELAADTMAVGERFMVRPELRGGDLLFRFFEVHMGFANERRIQLSFGDCEPHLLGIYQRLGFRPYSRTNVNSPEAGYLVPLVMVVEDVDYCRRLGSPIAHLMRDFGDDARIPACASRLIEGGSITSELFVDDDEYWSEVHRTLDQLEPSQFSLFWDLDEDEVEACLEKSNIVECAQGDRLLKQGNPARNMFVVLEGVLEVRRSDGASIAFLTIGDVVGEAAFLTGQPRSMDVYAFTDAVRVLSLSESSLRGLMADSPTVAAKLLLNLSRMLCVKMLRTNRN
ncbi:MAG: cyclic nucleotide-binding domain-containing protein [Thermoanaerobaculia bacterium]|nr:cyclic nucleotide-binding domain-containing protein [Thermoanaerobaculia bacterium]